ncbi:hypothetical protein A7R75_13485 [Mycolicibacterium llatzerense]|nr:hypothetical protein [Mycolicibacterium llatzerense]
MQVAKPRRSGITASTVKRGRKSTGDVRMSRAVHKSGLSRPLAISRVQHLDRCGVCAVTQLSLP